MTKTKKKTNPLAKRGSARAQISLQARETEQDSDSLSQRDGSESPRHEEARTAESASSAPAKPKRNRRRKVAGIGDALRQRGFDEHTIAENYVELTQRLRAKSHKSGSIEKLLVDVMKECSKYIEPQKPAERWGDRAARAPIHIHLVHNVSRPERVARESAQDAASEAAQQAVPGAAPQILAEPIALPEADSPSERNDRGDAGGVPDPAAGEQS
jgi:hypothetical protein